MTQQQKSADTFDILLDLKNILCKGNLKPKRLHVMIPLIMLKKLTLYGATVWGAGAFTRELSSKHTRAPSSFPTFLSFRPSLCLLLSLLFSALEDWDKFPVTSPVQILIHSVAQCWISGMCHCAHFFWDCFDFSFPLVFVAVAVILRRDLTLPRLTAVSQEYFLNSNTPDLWSGDNTAVYFSNLLFVLHTNRKCTLSAKNYVPLKDI